VAEHASEQGVTRTRSGSDVAPSTLLIAALASVAATAVVSRFGLESTLLGAGLTPVVVTIVREIARRPVQQVGAITAVAGSWGPWRHQQAEAPPDEPEAAPPPRPVPPAPSRAGRVRWGVVGAATIVGFLAAVAFFTVPDLIAGQSLVADRDSTFFSSSDGGPKEPAPTTTTTTETDTTATTPTTTAPAETETETVTVTSTTPMSTAPPADPAAPVTPPAAPTPAPAAPAP
jgi:hypothetical protein